MSVVINEFEIVTDPQPPRSPAPLGGDESQQAASQNAASPPRPDEISRIVERLWERKERVRAD